MTLAQLFVLSSCLNTGIAREAESRVGSNFRKGTSSMCAAFVADVVRKAGGNSAPVNPNMARNWLKWGIPVRSENIRKGDIVVCWRGSRRGSAGHILIYVGGGFCVHRSTKSAPIKKVALKDYSGKILGIRRASSKPR